MRSVMCFGDSNTHGTMALRAPGDLGRFARATRWPGQMAAALGPVWQVIEEGHPGRTTLHDDPIEGEHRNARRVLPALLETHRPLDLVILMLGTNDLKMRFSLPASDIALGVDRLLQTIAASNAGPGGTAPRALLVAPVPIIETGFLGEMFAGGAEKSRDLAPRFAAVAARQGAGFVDAGRLAQVDRTDGIHLDAAGHAALGSALAEAVRHLFPDAPA